MDDLLKQSLHKLFTNHNRGGGHDSRYYIKTEIDEFLAGKAPSSHIHTKSQITDFPTSMPASDVYSWAKASSKPSYSWSEITGVPSKFTPDISTYVCSMKEYIKANGTFDGTTYFITQDMSKTDYSGCNLLAAVTVPKGKYIVIKSCNYFNIDASQYSYNRIVLEKSDDVVVNIYGHLENRELLSNLCTTIVGYFECSDEVTIKSVCLQRLSNEVSVYGDCIVAIRIGE